MSLSTARAFAVLSVEEANHENKTKTGSSGIFREILIERNEDGVREGAVH
jgi:hypothetical protein